MPEDKKSELSSEQKEHLKKLRNLAKAFDDLKRHKEAGETYEEIIEILESTGGKSSFNSFVDFYWDAGASFAHSGGIDILQKQIEREIKDSIQAHKHVVYASILARVKGNEKRVEQAEKHFKKALELEKGEFSDDKLRKAEYYKLYSRFLSDQGRYEEAQNNLQESIKINPHKPEYALDLANIFNKAGSNNKAYILLSKAEDICDDKQNKELYADIKREVMRGKKIVGGALGINPDEPNDPTKAEIMAKKEEVLAPIYGDITNG